MNWLKRIIRLIAREEIEAMLNDPHYVNMIKTSLQNDIECKRVSENEEYLKDMASHA